MGTRVEGIQTELRARVKGLQTEIRDQQQMMEGQLAQMMVEMRRMMNLNRNDNHGGGKPPDNPVAAAVAIAEPGLMAPGINFIPERPNIGVNAGGVGMDGVELGAAGAYVPRPGMPEAMPWGNGGQMGFQQPRFARMECPRFDGDGFKDWLYKLEQFFDIEGTPEMYKIKVVSTMLEGRVLHWHQAYMRSVMGRVLTWTQYIADMGHRFANTAFEDPVAELVRLKHWGTVTDYQDKFERMLSQTVIPENFAISCFLSGLHKEIETAVRCFAPQTLPQTMYLARLQEATFQELTKRHNPKPQCSYPNHKPPPLPTHKLLTHTTMPPAAQKTRPDYSANRSNPYKPTRTMTQKEMDERRMKGMCYWCEEKYVPGHKCKRPQLYKIILEAKEELDIGYDDNVISTINIEEITEDVVPKADETPVISLHAFWGLEEYKTMKALTASFSVTVANGEQVKVQYGCKGLKWNMQGVDFQADFLIMPLGSCHMVLGVQWLSKLGSIVWNFDNLTMGFQWEGKQVLLQGNHHKDIFMCNGEEFKGNSSYGSSLILIHKSSGAAPGKENQLLKVKPAGSQISNHHEGISYPGRGVAADQRKIDCMVSWPTPKTIKALRGFLGLTGYYRKFIKDYGTVSRPLTDLLRKDSFKWSTAAQTAFQQLKIAMTKAPVLALPNFEMMFVVETDASGSGLGAVLMQQNRPIAFLSKTLAPKHQALSTYEKEMLAIVFAVKKWNCYLGLKKDVREFVRQCHTCQKSKYDTSASPGLLQPLAIPDRIWQDVTMDFIDGLPNSVRKDSILVVVDRSSKYAHFFPLSHPYSAMTIAQVFLDGVYKLHGPPTTITSDRDKIFLSRFWTELMKLLGVKLQLSTAYHPQTDGQTEVLNRCLETYLRCMTGEQPKQWAKWVSLAEYWYNSSFHSAIQTTPYQAVYGQPPPVHLPYLAGDSNIDSVDRSLTAREEALKMLKFHLSRAQQRMKAQADKHRSDSYFQVGDKVYLKLQPYRQQYVVSRANMKLCHKYCGPFVIVQKIGAVAYKLLLPATARIHPVFHVSQLKKTIGNHPVLTSLPRVDDDGLLLKTQLQCWIVGCAQKEIGLSHRS
ncbi:Ty3/gypsy retrotransposon protein [Quillaja saponaria]|uniref:Ty3/gypsy retrotransposon protein n=1 Tax=Quillaja saponaria TaxID=32244 RepID=A0AAD7PLK7_QUISA|nr:Ty3/gypsy retrotransposon protein [Quillaja saponaria]